MDYTYSAKNALVEARFISEKLKHGYVGTEHILMGLIKEGEGTAAKVLISNGLTFNNVLKLIEEQIAPSKGTLVKDKEIYTPKAKSVLDAAEAEARHFGSDSIGTEHILIAR